MKQLLYLITGLLFTITLAGQDVESKALSIPESKNDSIDLATNFHDLYDTENKPAFDLYESWNTNDLQYIKQDSLLKLTDYFLNMDSIAIILSDSLHEYSLPAGKDKVTSSFGRRYYRFHYGTDIDLMTGDSVFAAFDGQVRYTGYHRGYGKTVVIRHYNGLETVYSHLSKIKTDTNAYVNAGELIGYGGSTGRSTGAHLHFETRYRGAAFDSETIFDYDSWKLNSDTLWLSANQFSYLGPVKDRKNARYHYIKKGDNLGKIARMYGTTIQALCRVNGISRSTTLRIGKKLRVR
ncbi:MAG: peptidoglycan DD-metalloendopeptidase family protein [Bacteroidales bacterium]